MYHHLNIHLNSYKFEFKTYYLLYHHVFEVLVVRFTLIWSLCVLAVSLV